MMNLTYTFGLMGIMASPAFTMWAFTSKSPKPFAPQQVWASAACIGFILIVFTAVQGLGGHFLGADREFMYQHEELANPVMEFNLYGVDLMDTEGKQDLLVPHLINLLSATAPWLVGLLCLCALAAIESTASSYWYHCLGSLAIDHTRSWLGNAV